MRWEALFADLEAGLDAAAAQDLRDEVAELTRAERAQVRLADRLRASRATPLRLVLRDGQSVDGVVVDTAPQWVLLAPDPVRRALVPVPAVTAVVGLAPYAAPSAGEVERRLALGHALRALARDRTAVRVDADGVSVSGRLERVGADHVDVTPMHAERATAAWTFAFDALVVVRSG
ncbi:hypothetical protein CWIS_00645 [Cellulomonas sp. A375-1]|uniref:Fis family transcriptional regulator n=1 Tax=Cellulomonas gelida TaxID=1712 RepID=A0A4Y3KHV0_9CELL|nr:MULTISPECIES: hypothetical protein [Cellulomonas]KMM47266.1 hypothetical protein CWIS_00645 [Cellulomonas sp. A375-1]MCR6703906.1 hypothetical protein [Cellulomonas sp.]GEA83473.1 hypothetical protein CGE01nite_07240 [Cellulomonas gelida]GGL24670.1 hypothetical protein GCM10009774_13950 [Cellulomonas gelida]